MEKYWKGGTKQSFQGAETQGALITLIALCVIAVKPSSFVIHPTQPGACFRSMIGLVPVIRSLPPLFGCIPSPPLAASI